MQIKKRGWLTVIQAVDCIVNDDYHFTTDVECYFVCKMKILADEFLPFVINPLLFKSGFLENGGIVGKRLQSVVKAILLAFYCLIAEGVPMFQNRGIIECINCLVNTLLDDYPYALG